MSYELSVVIPVFNVDIRSLVGELLWQGRQSGLSFEILCLDDGSKPEIITLNQTILDLPNTRYEVLPRHLGRTAIRRQLALQARFSTLLMLDNDSQIVKPDFIRHYLFAQLQAPVLVGGTCYQTTKPAKPYLLRWVYGRAREEKAAALRNQNPYQAFYLNNILLPRELFLQFSPPDLAEDYGHEDSAFGDYLEKAGIRVVHLDNPVLHAGLDPAEVFLSKTRQAVTNLFQLHRQAGLGAGTRLLRVFRLIKTLGLQRPFLWAYGQAGARIVRNLHGEAPRLWLFDLYKLYYFTLEDLKCKKPRKQERGFSKT